MIIEKSILLSVSKEDIPENGKFVVPDEVTEIGEAVFFECKLLKEIYFPKSLISIGDHTFYNCKFLEKIHICDGLISIGNFAFFGCESLREINLPESVQKNFRRYILVLQIIKGDLSSSKNNINSC